MAQRFTRLLAALALLVFMAPSMVTWGQTRSEVTYTFSEHYSANTTLTDVAIAFDNSITGTFGKGNGSTAPQYYTNGTAVRWYGGNTLAITASNATVSEIVLTYTQKNKTVTTDVGTYNHDNGTWSGSASSVTFTVESGSGHNRVSAIKVTYSASGSTPTCATPTFSPAAGTYTQAQSVSISCATEGATVYYTTNGQDPTTSSTVYSGAINVSSNTTIKAMAAKSGFDNSAVASATYNFVTPMTIAEVRAQQTDDVITTGTVTSCVGNTGYIQDATAAICVYGTSLTVGDNICVVGSLTNYNGLLEIINPQVTVISSGNTINPETMTVAQAVASTNQGWYIRIEDATVTAISDKNVTIAQGDANVVVRFANTSDITFEVNDIISLNGNIGAFNGVQIANPQNVTVQENTNPIISAENVSIAFDATGGNIDFTIDNPVSGGVTSATTNDEWLTLGTVGSATVPFTCTANTATTARTATVVLTYTYNRATVTKEVTVTQAAFEASHVTWDLSIASYDEITDSDIVTWSSEYATMTNSSKSGGTSASNYLGGDSNNRTSSRFYNGNTLTISPAAGYAITSVVFTATSVNYANAFAGSEWTNATASASGTTVTVTPTDGTTAMVAVIGGTCGFTSVTVYYVVNNAPSITANNVEITYDTDADEIEFVINNPVSGGSLVASTESDWLEVDSDPMSGDAGTIEFTCSVNTAANTRTAIVTLTYNYNRAIVIKEVTVTQAGNPNAMMTIAEVRAQQTGDVVTTGTVTSCVGTTGYIQDATAAICVYGTSLTVGDNISVLGTLSTYHGLLEIINPEVTVISQGNTVTPELMTIADAVASTNQGWYIRIEDATVTEIDGQNTNIAQGENTIVVRGISGVEYGVNDIISLDGNIGAHDGVQIANPQNIEVQAVPSITITPDSFELDANSHMAEVLTAITYKNIVVEQGSGVDSFEVQYYDAENHEIESTWCTVGAVANETGFDLAIFAGPNEGGEARTVYFRLYAHDEEANVVYSNLVTVTQAAAVVPPTPGTWVLTDLADLTEDDVFVIVGTRTDETYGGDYAMSNDNGTSNPPAAVAVTVVEGTLSAEPAANLQWNISITEEGYIFYPNGETETWLYCTNSNNGVRVGTNENNVFTISEEGYLFNNATSRYLGIYNTQDWRCYTSINNNIAGQSFAFYKKVESPTTETQTIALSSGANWVSFNVKTTLDDLKAALQGVNNATDIKITSQNNGFTYWDGSTWRGTLNPFDVSQMFVIEVIGACEISLEAMPVNPARPITIVNGTNWIGFPFSGSMSLSNAFSGFAENGDKILAPDGSFATYNDGNWEGGLTELLHGQGYKYEVTTTGERILVFPSSK